MAQNPNLNPQNDAENTGIQAGTKLNDPTYINKQGYNSFPLPGQVYFTPRFAELHPFLATECVPGDRIQLNTAHSVRAYTMVAPLLTGIRLHKDVFSCPMSAIMPHSWQKIFVHPKKGEDIPDDVYPTINIGEIIEQCKLVSDLDVFLAPQFYALCIAYLTAGFGTLPESLSYKTHILCPNELAYTDAPIDLPTFGEKLDKWFAALVEAGTGFEGKYYTEEGTEDGSWSIGGSAGETKVDLPTFRRQFLNVVYSNRPFMFTAVTPGTSGTSAETLATEYANSFKELFVNTYFVPHKKLSAAFLAAYQMICAQFYTNDNVDSIFSSELYVNNLEGIANKISGFGGYEFPTYFEQNGAIIQYDFFSGKNLQALINEITNVQGASNFSIQRFYLYAIFQNIFGYHECLKYGDYFTTARTSPLAVGDVNVQVAPQGVNVIDITKNIVKQRFLNAVNRAGQLIEDYSKAIFGVAPANLPPQPRFICHETFNVDSNEVSSTYGDTQGKLVTNVNDTQSRYMFDVYIDEPCILMGITYFDVIPAYTQATNPVLYHENRYDYFNPMMQNIGDQIIPLSQLNGRELTEDGDDPFGYTLQDGEYKFSFSSAHGGFIKQLPGWAFAKPYRHYTNVDSEFIRLHRYELDEFYSSLSGFSPETYFHFICSFINNIQTNRKMEYRPGIL